MQNVKHFLLFIGMLLAGLAITAIIGGTMDARRADQEQRREEAYQSH